MYRAAPELAVGSGPQSAVTVSPCELHHMMEKMQTVMIITNIACETCMRVHSALRANVENACLRQSATQRIKKKY